MKEIVPIVFSEGLKRITIEQSNIGFGFDQRPFVFIA